MMAKSLRTLIVLLLVGATLVPAAFAQGTTPSEERALQAYREGEFSRAVQLYTTALSETDDPTHRARLHVHIAWTLFALGREDEVETHLRAALVEDPDLTLVSGYYTQEFLDLFEAARRRPVETDRDPATPPPPDLEATVASVDERIEAGSDLEGALVDLDRLLATYSSDSRLIPRKIRVLELLGRQDEARELAERAGGDDGYAARMSIPELILRANRLLDSGDVTTSLQLLREAVARQPGNVAALELMAEASQRAARWQEAEFALKSALSLQPDNLGLRLRLGEVFLAMDDLSAARDAFRQLVELYPHSDRALAALGLLDARLGAEERAMDALRNALDENPLLPEVQLAYGELLLARGRIAEAIESLRAASNLLQEDPQVAARLGQAFLAQGRDEEALTLLRTASGAGYRPDDVVRALALVLVRSGLLSEAERTIDNLGTDERGDTDVVRSLLLLARDRVAEAEGLLRRIARERSGDPRVLNLLGVSLYRQAKYAEAVRVLTRAAEIATDDPAIAENLAHASAAAAAVDLAAAAQEVPTRSEG